MGPGFESLKVHQNEDHPNGWSFNFIAPFLRKASLFAAGKKPLPLFFHKKTTIFRWSFFFMSALRIFPGRHQPSIVRMKLLNYRVRNGNGWDQLIINTDYLKVTQTLSSSCTLKTEQKIYIATKIPLRSSPRSISISQLNMLPCLHP